MTKQELKAEMRFADMLEGYAPYDRLMRGLAENTPISVAGVVDRAQPQLIAAIAARTGTNTLVVTYSDMEARAVAVDLRVYHPQTYVFPSKEYIFYNIETAGRETANARLSVLDKLICGSGVIVTASVDAIMAYTAAKDKFKAYEREIKAGDIVDMGELVRELCAMGYKREEMIEGPGQFAARGGIIDVYSPASDGPVRIEFWDDEIDSVRSFDADSQLTIENIKSVHIIPVTEILMSEERRGELAQTLEGRAQTTQDEDEKKTLLSDAEALRERMSFPSIDKYISAVYDDLPTVLDYFTDSDTVIIQDPKRISERIENYSWEMGERVVDLKAKGILEKSSNAEYIKDKNELIADLQRRRLIALEMLTHTANVFSFGRREMFTTKTILSFHGKMEYLFLDLNERMEKGYTIVILAASYDRVKNLVGILKDRGMNARAVRNGVFVRGEVAVIQGSQMGGYEYPDIKLAVVSERDIFESKRARERRHKENKERIKSYSDISPGDYVVHERHGIGEYAGTQKMTVNNVSKDYLKIKYYGTGVLYVPIDQMNMLYKYGGSSDGSAKAVKLSNLGTQDWAKARAKVKASTDELARQLVKLYAERSNSAGYAFSADTPWQKDFEDTFEYIETPDQLQSIEEVKADMEKPRPMDRLLCGDVGFGKTEVALRAAFKAVCDSKQVAYLCPTTVLAMQQYETFAARMADFPITVELLSRFRTRKQQNETIKRLRDGRTEVVIGTHRLLSKDVEFKDLGLLIVDEEQRFGVAAKEKLKELKKNVDVLTMTATPIPRTLHMAMTSVRDMSLLQQPPQNRYPVQTYVLEFSDTVIIDALARELARGGQVFYLFNRVKGIYGRADWIKRNFPDINVAVGHGRLKESELEDIMYDMVSGRTQVLICTTIIETGLDIPNANTMIIEDADRMGLAQLYQLRGRVGRSNRAAYAYLTYSREKTLSPASEKRLSAIREFTEFGSGFKIAMRDLEIRGAGNILGAEQHGHMDNVGYDLYTQILQESIDSARGIEKKHDSDVSVDIAVNAYIPETYISSSNQRIDMYKKIAAIESEDEREAICGELADRYGEPPKSVINVIDVASLKIYARRAKCTDIAERRRVVSLTFTEDIDIAQTAIGLNKLYRDRVKIARSEKPTLTVKMCDADKNSTDFVKNLLINIITLIK